VPAFRFVMEAQVSDATRLTLANANRVKMFTHSRRHEDTEGHERHEGAAIEHRRTLEGNDGTREDTPPR